MKANDLLTTWSDFLTSLLQRFDSTLFNDPQGVLSKLSQTGSVIEFQTNFEELINKVTGIFEGFLVRLFITGLKPALRRELAMSLMEEFSLARVYESRLEETHGSEL